MTKTITDSRLIAFSILGYIFCYFGWQLPLILVVAYALAIGKDNALSKQALQALYLYIAYAIVIRLIDAFFGSFIWLVGQIDAWRLANALASINGVITTILGLGLLLLVLVAILKLTRKEAPNLPILGRLAELTLGIAAAKPAAAAAPQTPPAATPPAASPPTQTPPAQTPPPSQPTPPAPQTPPAPEPKPAGEWTCECGKSNAGKFCVNCGKPQA